MFLAKLDILLQTNHYLCTQYIMMDTLEDVTYIEPFVGGGAMLFYMLQHYPNIRHAVINDVNPD